ncbi:MAG: hypothetical protein RBR88_01600, partial [Candidatus Saccharicenans sp.]|nr:hypothetical protein [Candidatus Saccharicenans sp.]
HLLSEQNPELSKNHRNGESILFLKWTRSHLVTNTSLPASFSQLSTFGQETISSGMFFQRRLWRQG